MSFNKITIVGNLGKDPELRYTAQGQAVCNFSLASNERREGQDKTTWFKITLWGKQAEAADKYLSKGSPVYISGTLRVSDWTDRDGKARYTLEVEAREMEFISSVQAETKEFEDSNIGMETVKESGESYWNPRDDIPF